MESPYIRFRKEQDRINRCNLRMAYAGTALIAFSMFAFNVKAANYSVTPEFVQTSAHFSATPTGDPDNMWAFSDTWNFTIAPDMLTASSITTIRLDGGIQGMAAYFDGGKTSDFIFDPQKGQYGDTTLSLVTSFLSAGDHTITVTGVNRNNAYSYGGNITVSPVAAVPIPAALWMFGAAVMGLVGMNQTRGKK